MAEEEKTPGTDKPDRSDQQLIDYRLLRLLMGAVAISMPFVVWIFSDVPLTSISASHLTDARDIYVGMLFAVGTFLIAYTGSGSSNKEKGIQILLSTLGGIAAFTAALFPITRDCTPADTSTHIHNVGAILLFVVLGYFCLWPFRKRAEISKSDKAPRRLKLYIFCGAGIYAILVFLIVINILISQELLSCELLNIKYRVIFVAEFFMLIFFGLAWFVAGKWWFLSYYVDENEAYHPHFSWFGLRNLFKR